MHMAIFNIPPKLAVALDIPLVVWGEDSGFEYSGDGDERTGFRMDRAWFRKYGVTHGTSAADWVADDLTAKDLAAYFGPSDEELEARGVLAVFLGYYLGWDPTVSASVARAHGFVPRAEGPKTGYYNYADLDDDFVSVHHWLKWYKFGFTRLSDNLSLEIRNGRMTREQAVSIVGARGDDMPHNDIAVFCDFVGIDTGHFFEVAERHRSREIWTRRDGVWQIDGFLVPDWKWT
jgi:hypothetical protein